MGPSDDELAMVADGKRPYLAVVALELLNEFELVAVPVLEHLVFAYGPEVMRRLPLALTRVVTLEGDLHNALVMGEERFVAIAKVEAPDLDVLVGGARYY